MNHRRRLGFRFWLKHGALKTAPLNSETANCNHDVLLDELAAFVPLEADLLRRVAEHRCELRTTAIELGFGEKAPHLEPIRDLPLRYATENQRAPREADPRPARRFFPYSYERPAAVEEYTRNMAPPVDVQRESPRPLAISEGDIAYVIDGLEGGVAFEALLSSFSSQNFDVDELRAALLRGIDASFSSECRPQSASARECIPQRRSTSAK